MSASFSLAQSSETSEALKRASDPAVLAADAPKYSAAKNQTLFLDVLDDQKRLWRAPRHFRRNDTSWLLPLSAVTAVLIPSDKSINDAISKTHSHTSQAISNTSLAAELVAAGAFWKLGMWKFDPHAAETGRLASEAAINGVIVNRAVQMVSRRKRPESGPYSGNFFVGGNSFPSDHSVMAWSIASVVAHEYPGWATRLLSYGTAATVSLTRVSAQKHFTSDIFVGGTLGWIIGQSIYRAHHDPELPGVTWGETSKTIERVSNPMHLGTTYVPVDSWVYPAFDRLSALGYAPPGSQNLRPWTRLEFARLLREAAIADPSSSDDVGTLYEELKAEFADDTRILSGEKNVGATLDSVYTRFMTISARPLTDGLHFGQTIVNDYGRPYQQGLNAVMGVATHAEAGPLAFYVRGEYQHTPSAPALPYSVRTTTAMADALPVAPETGFPTINRFRLLESYVALNLIGWQLSFGKQSLWWGPAYGSDMMLSNNAEPVNMLRLSRVSPWRLPGFLRAAGRIHSDTFLAQVDGYHFLRLGPSFELTGSYEHKINPQPYLWGYKLSVQPTANLQLGVSVTTIFAGLGRPMTFGTFLHTLSFNGNAQAVEPGDRLTGFDFSYRVPGLRKWLLLYSGSVSEDEPNPIVYPRRSAWNPGIYLPAVPGIPKLDLHFETAYTNLPNDPRSGVFYTNSHYAGGYTNNGQIMGDWVGPQARAYHAWTNYWRNGRNKIQFGFRTQVVDPSYVGGGRLTDVNGSYDFQVRPRMKVKTGLQYERWKFPLLARTPQSNVTFSVQFTYEPKPAKIVHPQP